MPSDRSPLRQLAHDSAVYGLADVAAKVMAVLAMPFLTRLLAPAQIGILDLLSVLVAFGTPLILLGSDFSLQSFYFDKNVAPDALGRTRLVSSVFWLITVWGGALTAAGLVFSGPISVYLFAGRISTGMIRLGVLFLFASIFHWFSRYLLRLQFKARTYALLSFAVSTASLAGGLVILLFNPNDLRAYYGFSTGMMWLGGVIGILIIRHELGFCLDLKAARRSLAVGLPYMPATLLYLLMTLMDRILLNQSVPLSQLGLYAVGLKIASSLQMAAGIFSTAWFPVAIRTYYQSVDRWVELYRRVFVYVVGAFGWMAVAVALFAAEILWLLAPPAYQEAAPVVGPLSLSVMALAMNYATSVGAVLAKKPLYAVVPMAISALLNIVFCLVWIPHWGIHGAAWSLASAQGILSLLGLWTTEHLLPPFRFERRRPFIISLLALIGVLLGSYAMRGAFPGLLPIKTFVLLAYGIVLWRFEALPKAKLVAEGLAWLKSKLA